VRLVCQHEYDADIPHRAHRALDPGNADCIDLDLAGGDVSAGTGVPFLDHMLTALGKHGRFGLVVECDGDVPY
jgi:hypothetical protein